MYYVVNFGETEDNRLAYYLTYNGIGVGSASFLDEFEGMEVVGNIYENPELLEIR